jgi:hypothetical protein
MVNTDQLAKKLSDREWVYADADPSAKAELQRRIEAAGRKLKLITYSDLVRGVTFCLPTVRQGAPFQIEIDDWTGLDRAILGNFLGAISAETYQTGQFLATALVVNKAEFKPSDQFFKWMEELGVLPNLKEDTILAFWADQVNRAHNWYGRH